MATMQYHVHATCSGDDCDDDDLTVDNHYNHDNGTTIEASGRSIILLDCVLARIWIFFQKRSY